MGLTLIDQQATVSACTWSASRLTCAAGEIHWPHQGAHGGDLVALVPDRFLAQDQARAVFRAATSRVRPRGLWREAPCILLAVDGDRGPGPAHLSGPSAARPSRGCREAGGLAQYGTVVVRGRVAVQASGCSQARKAANCFWVRRLANSAKAVTTAIAGSAGRHRHRHAGWPAGSACPSACPP